MAKKSKKSSLGLILTCVSILTAVLSFVMFVFLPIFKATGKVTNKVGTFGGFSMIFGGTVTEKIVAGNSSTTLDVPVAFNVMAFFAFLLVVLGIVGVVASLVLKKNVSKMVIVVSGLLFIVAAVMMFAGAGSSINAICKGTAGANATAEDVANEVKAFNTLYTSSIGVGTIIGGISACVAGVAAVFKPFVK